MALGVQQADWNPRSTVLLSKSWAFLETLYDTDSSLLLTPCGEGWQDAHQGLVVPDPVTITMFSYPDEEGSLCPCTKLGLPVDSCF